MRILIATSDYPPALGGMSEYSAAWEHGLREGGCDVRVIVRDWKSGLLRDPVNALRVLRNERADIFMAHTWIGWGPALAYLKGKRHTRVVLSAHGAEIVGPKSRPWYRFLMRQSFKSADRVFAVSSFTADHVAELGLSRERIAIIGNGVDTTRFTPPPSNEETILTVGGLVDRKGHDIVIDAMARLKDRRPKLKYIIAGGWSLNSSREHYLRQKVRDLGLDDRITFTGFVAQEDLPALYRKARIFVMTGREVKEKGWVEGFGISYLEAAASGLPIIATATGGVPDATTAENTIYVPEENPAATAEAIINLLDDTSRWDKMSRASLAWANENTWDRRVKEGLEIFERIMRG